MSFARYEQAIELLETHRAAILDLIPEGCPVVDVHTHLGRDEDGSSLSLEDHLASMERNHVDTSVVFALNDPERVPAYRVPNDRVLAWAAESDGKLVPFVRLALDGDDPVREAARCIDRGARGIKLHPRSQAFSVTDPRLGETVLDPACGTGGFLVEAFNHLSKQVKTVADRRVLQEKSLLGCEAKTLPYLLCQMNLLLHGLDAPQIDPGNSLRFKLTDIGERERVDVILTNPPFGGEEERGIQGNFPEDKQTAETALLFLQLIMRKLRRHGSKARAAVVVPDGTLSASGVAVAIRRDLLRDFKLYAVVQLPPGAFAPYAETARTNILFFNASGPTSDIWYYQVPPPNGRKQCSKNNPLTDADFEPVLACWLGRKKSVQAWIVKHSEIDPESCDLLRRNPSVANPAVGLDLADVIHRAAESIQQTLADLRELEQDASLQDPELRNLGDLLQKAEAR
jgi:type I restriction-modification system DNA methylase subunit